MGILSKKTQASTLVEVIVALIIISISFGLALMAIDSNSKSSNIQLMIKAHQSLLMQKNRCLREKRFFSEETDYGQIHIVQTLQDYSSAKELKLLKIEVYDANKKLLDSEQELIIVE